MENVYEIVELPMYISTHCELVTLEKETRIKTKREGH